jgi:hypothetical protein
MEFAFDGGQGAEKEIAGVGHDGSTARLDAVVCLEVKEAGEEVIDGDGGLEFGETGDEFGGEVGGLVAFVPTAGMVEAEAGGRIGDGHAHRPLRVWCLQPLWGGAARAGDSLTEFELVMVWLMIGLDFLRSESKGRSFFGKKYPQHPAVFVNAHSKGVTGVTVL